MQRVPLQTGWADFSNAVKRELDITFNPRTNGAKIAGRCPDTQSMPNEVQNAIQEAEAEAEGGAFNLQAFTVGPYTLNPLDP
jgi:hypothetical protein